MIRMRTKLFVPGSRPELFRKAALSATDAVSFDLEDAVAADRKIEARNAVAGFVHKHMADYKKIAIVRVNPVASPLFSADIAAVVGVGLHFISLPKVESQEDIKNAVAAIESAKKAAGLNREIGVLPTIETPKGLRLVFEIASADARVVGLQIGFADLFLPYGIDPEDDVASQNARFTVRMAAAEVGIPAFDGAFLNVTEESALKAEAKAARRIGFSGKSCIHPSQIPVLNDIFSPLPEELAFATKVLVAAEQAEARGLGAFTVDGRMVDAPVIEYARAVISIANKSVAEKKKTGDLE